MSNRGRTSVTKDHESSPSALLRRISDQQSRAIDLLLQGSSQTEAAAEIGVARETLNRWTRYHPGFKAAWNSRREAINKAHADRLRVMRLAALEIIEDAIEQGDARLALDFWRASSAVELEVVGPTDPDKVLKEEAKRLSPTSLERLIDKDRVTDYDISQTEEILNRRLSEDV